MFRSVILVLALAILCVRPLVADGEFPPVKFEEVDPGMPYKVEEVPATDPEAMKGLKIAFVAAHGFEEIELTYPLKYFKARGAAVEIITPDWIKGRVMAVRFLKPSIWLPVANQISQVKPTDYCAIVVPGGAWNPIIMRTDGKVLEFLKGANEAGKLIASVCHGPQVLLTAGLVRGKEVTGVGDIRGDLRNAGATVIEDRPVVLDGNILTSRDPNDLKEFSMGIQEYLKKNLKFCKSWEAVGEATGSKEAASRVERVERFVRKWFSLFDRNAPVDDYLVSLADAGLYIVFPEATLRSHADFRKWYSGILQTVSGACHTIQKLNVTPKADGSYAVDMVVHWKATVKDKGPVELLVDQAWELEDRNGQLTITQYVVTHRKP